MNKRIIFLLIALLAVPNNLILAGTMGDDGWYYSGNTRYNPETNEAQYYSGRTWVTDTNPSTNPAYSEYSPGGSSSISNDLNDIFNRFDPARQISGYVPHQDNKEAQEFMREAEALFGGNVKDSLDAKDFLTRYEGEISELFDMQPGISTGTGDSASYDTESQISLDEKYPGYFEELMEDMGLEEMIKALTAANLYEMTQDPVKRDIFDIEHKFRLWKINLKEVTKKIQYKFEYMRKANEYLDKLYKELWEKNPTEASIIYDKAVERLFGGGVGPQVELNNGDVGREGFYTISTAIVCFEKFQALRNELDNLPKGNEEADKLRQSLDNEIDEYAKEQRKRLAEITGWDEVYFPVRGLSNYNDPQKPVQPTKKPTEEERRVKEEVDQWIQMIEKRERAERDERMRGE